MRHNRDFHDMCAEMKKNFAKYQFLLLGWRPWEIEINDGLLGFEAFELIKCPDFVQMCLKVCLGKL